MVRGACRLTVSGRVQGVGFRPYVYRLATSLGLAGWVRNTSGEVHILIEGRAAVFDEFKHRLLKEAPPLAQPVLSSSRDVSCAMLEGFSIDLSEEDLSAGVHLPADYFACEACQRELLDPGDRRYRYPFINCTECGPRYTIIDALPYDRGNTAMADFALCEACRLEYADPLDRRFHAEPLACSRCGPSLAYSPGAAVRGEQAFEAAIDVLESGGTVAVRGVGGYHLLCDATNERSVSRLRERKRRPHKPLAVMVPQEGADGCDRVRRIANVSDREAALIADPERPILLCRARPGAGLAAGIAPRLGEIGLLLPYSPLHHLIMAAVARPLVATSGNISGEPVITDPAEAERRLGEVADGFLHHDRPIRRPADDSVCRVISGRASPIRLGRGAAPLELRLPFAVREPTLAVGGHMKNTVALAWGDRAVVSPHVGDLDSPRGLAVFAATIEDLQRLYGVKARHVVCDAHPGYASTRWAKASGLSMTRIFHHHAHASALWLEHGFGQVDRDMLVFTWDGTGYGPDGTIWGGEGLHGAPGRWRRATSFRPFRLVGGDRAAREPWRSGAALCWELDAPAPVEGEAIELAETAWRSEFNCHDSTAVGRLFDAAASLIGICQHVTYEGQAPMMLEALADGELPQTKPLPLFVDGEGILRADWSPIATQLSANDAEAKSQARWFHSTLAATAVELARSLRTSSGVETVGLTGGVFQNRCLTEAITERLERDGFKTVVARSIPCNDAGISVGQLIEGAVMSTDQPGEGGR